MKSLQKSQSLSPQPASPASPPVAAIVNGNHQEMNGYHTAKKSKSDSCVHQPEGDNSLSSADVQQVMNKLRRLVPNLPQDRSLTKLELMESVIAYIKQLEKSLHDPL